MTTDHPQHSTNTVIMRREDFITACVEGLKTLAHTARHRGVLTAPNQRAVLHNAQRSAIPFPVRPAPMPGGDAA